MGTVQPTRLRFHTQPCPRRSHCRRTATRSCPTPCNPGAHGKLGGSALTTTHAAWSLQPLTQSARSAASHPAFRPGSGTQSHRHTNTTVSQPSLTLDLCKHTSTASHPHVTSTPSLLLATARRGAARPTGPRRRPGPGPGLPTARGPPQAALESLDFVSCYSRRGRGRSRGSHGCAQARAPFLPGPLGAALCLPQSAPSTKVARQVPGRRRRTRCSSAGFAARSRVRGSWGHRPLRTRSRKGVMPPVGGSKVSPTSRVAGALNHPPPTPTSCPPQPGPGPLPQLKTHAEPTCTSQEGECSWGPQAIYIPFDSLWEVQTDLRPLLSPNPLGTGGRSGVAHR